MTGILTNRSMPKSVIIPELCYADVRAAADWLVEVFGFRVRLRIGDHRFQLAFGTGDLIVVQGAGETASSFAYRIMVRVADVDAHCRHVVASGVAVESEPQTHVYGERQYRVTDPGGHVWIFSQTMADIDPASWGGELAGSLA